MNSFELRAERKACAEYDADALSAWTFDGAGDPLDCDDFLPDDYLDFQVVVPTMEQTRIEFTHATEPDDVIDVAYRGMMTYGLLLKNEYEAGGEISPEEKDFMNDVFQDPVVDDQTFDYLSNIGNFKMDDGRQVKCRMLPDRSYDGAGFVVNCGENGISCPDPHCLEYRHECIPPLMIDVEKRNAVRWSYTSPGQACQEILRSLRPGNFDPGKSLNTRFSDLRDLILHTLLNDCDNLYSKVLKWIRDHRKWRRKYVFSNGTKFQLSYMIRSNFCYHTFERGRSVFFRSDFDRHAIGLAMRTSIGGKRSYFNLVGRLRRPNTRMKR